MKKTKIFLILTLIAVMATVGISYYYKDNYNKKVVEATLI